MTLFDIIAVAVLVVSAIVGFFRGALREMLTVAAFVVAALLAGYGLRFAGPPMRAWLDPDWTGTVAAVVIVFVVSYIALRMAGAGLVKRIHANEAAGALDRTVGLGFGLVRALVVLGAFQLMLVAATPPERMPAWITGASLYPLTQRVGEVLKAFAPKGLDIAGRMKPALEQAVRDGTHGSTLSDGYDAKARGKIDDLVERSR